MYNSIGLIDAFACLAHPSRHGLGQSHHPASFSVPYLLVPTSGSIPFSLSID